MKNRLEVPITSRRQVRISTHLARFNRRGRSTSDDLQDSVSGLAVAVLFVASSSILFLAQVGHARRRLRGHCASLEGSTSRRGIDVRTTISDTYPSPSSYLPHPPDASVGSKFMDEPDALMLVRKGRADLKPFQALDVSVLPRGGTK